MVMESVSVSLHIPRDNYLEEFRVVIKEKKQEVKKMFAELKKLLGISENTATNRLDRIYTDVRKGVERRERTVTQLEQAKCDLNSTLVDNIMSSLLQTTNQNFDDRITKARNSACVVPKHISLRWSIEELKQSIENVCEVISSSTTETPVSTEQPNKIEIELQKQSEYSKHILITESANTEDHITSLTTRIRELEDELTAKDTYISRVHSELENIRIHYSNLEKELQTLKSANQPRSRNEAYQLYSNTNPQRTPDSILRFKSKVKDLETQLTLKNSECEDLQRKVVSLRLDLGEAQDMLAAKLESPKGVGESVHLSLPPGLTRKDYSYKTSQSADVDYVRIPKKQMEQYETNTQDLKSQISLLRNQLESKVGETAILKVSLDYSREELENTMLRSQQTQQTNPTKVQSKRDSQTEKVVAKHKPLYNPYY